MATKNDFDYPAIKALDVLRYYVNYMDFEKPLLDVLPSFNMDDVSHFNLFKRYKNTYMSVGRNFEGQKDREILEKVKIQVKNDKNDVVGLSNSFNKMGLLNRKITKAYSASSKLLWLFNKDVIIIDTLNREALEAKENDYNDFCEEWEKLFAKKLPEIIEIIKSNNLSKIDKVMQESWFPRRVFDQYLMGIKK
jgi:hypothetical protein